MKRKYLITFQIKHSCRSMLAKHTHTHTHTHKTCLCVLVIVQVCTWGGWSQGENEHQQMKLLKQGFSIHEWFFFQTSLSSPTTKAISCLMWQSLFLPVHWSLKITTEMYSYVLKAFFTIKMQAPGNLTTVKVVGRT